VRNGRTVSMTRSRSARRVVSACPQECDRCPLLLPRIVFGFGTLPMARGCCPSPTSVQATWRVG
jgi:hypothetical protein